MSAPQSLRKAPSALRCALCHEPLQDVEPRACAGCGTLLHAECRDELAGCPTLGCAAPLAQADKPALLPRLPLAAWAIAAVLVTGWACALVALLGGVEVMGFAAFGVVTVLPPALLAQAGIQAALRWRSRRRAVSRRLALAWTVLPLAAPLLAHTATVVYEARYAYVPASVSEVVPSGGWRAQIVRQERAKFELGDEPFEARWLLQVTPPDGRAAEGLVKRRDGFTREELRGARYDLRWTAPGWSLAIAERAASAATRAQGFVFRDGVRVTGALNEVVRVDPADAQPLDAATRERLALLPARIDGRDRLRQVRLRGSYGGASSLDFVCDAPDVLLILGSDFSNHGQVISRGPILVVERGHPGELASRGWVFFADDSSPWGFRPPLAREVFVSREGRVDERDLLHPPTRVPGP